MYLLLEGEAKVEHVAQDERATELSILKEGDVFGEIALVNEVDRTANVIAVNEVKVLSIEEEDLKRVHRFSPRISLHLFMNLSRILGKRLMVANIRLSEGPQRQSG